MSREKQSRELERIRSMPVPGEESDDAPEAPEESQEVEDRPDPRQPPEPPQDAAQESRSAWGVIQTLQNAIMGLKVAQDIGRRLPDEIALDDTIDETRTALLDVIRDLQGRYPL
jgi:hypothetical protein